MVSIIRNKIKILFCGSDNSSSTDNTITIRPSILLMEGREDEVFSSSALSD